MSNATKIGRATLDKMPTAADCREVESIAKRKRMVEECARLATRAYQRACPGTVLPAGSGSVTWEPSDKGVADRCPRFVAYFRKEVARFCGLLPKPSTKPAKRKSKTARKTARKVKMVKTARKVKTVRKSARK